MPPQYVRIQFYWMRMYFLHLHFDFHIESFELVRETERFGVIFDSQISFSLHMDHLVDFCSNILGFLCRTCEKFDDEKAIKSIYYSLSIVSWTYPMLFWYIYATHKTRLYRIDDRFIRFPNHKITKIYVNNKIGEFCVEGGYKLLEIKVKNQFVIL